MLFIAFYIAAQISILDVHIHLKKITYKPYSIVIECFLSYIIYSGCCLVYYVLIYYVKCYVYFCCVKALTCRLWLKLMLFQMLQPPLFLSCQVYIPSIIHLSKRIYFQFYLSTYALGGHYKSSLKNRNPRLCNFSRNCIFKIAHLLCCYPGNTGSL